MYIRNFGQGSYWLKGVIVNRHGPLTWLVRMNDTNPDRATQVEVAVIPRRSERIRKPPDYFKFTQ